MSEEYTPEEIEEKYFPERLERMVACPKCGGILSLPTINDPCSLCRGNGWVKYKKYRAYYRERNTQ